MRTFTLSDGTIGRPPTGNIIITSDNAISGEMRIYYKDNNTAIVSEKATSFKRKLNCIYI